MKKNISVMLALMLIMSTFAFAEKHIYDKVEDFTIEWTLNDAQETEIQELLEKKTHTIKNINRPASDSFWTIKFHIESDFGKKVVAEEAATVYELNIVYNFKSGSGLMTLKTDLLDSGIDFEAEMTNILTILWEPFCYTEIDRTCGKPIVTRTQYRKNIYTLEFGYPKV